MTVLSTKKKIDFQRLSVNTATRFTPGYCAMEIGVNVIYRNVIKYK